jgi:hypothetical protein
VGDNFAAAGDLSGIVADGVQRLWPPNEIGLTFALPSQWKVNAALLAGTNGRTLVFSNVFTNAPGGLFPRGGAEIEISREPTPAESLMALIARRLSGNRNTAVESITVGGTAGKRISYDADFDPAIVLGSVEVYVPRAGSLFTLSLSYQSTDPMAASFITTYDAMLASISFTP